MRERVGAYRIVQRLGGGGMGEVFEALHEQLGRRVAVKFLHRELCGHPQVATRFLNEARAVNIVRHPTLVDVFEMGQADDGALYIVMELLEGETLSARLRQRSLLPPGDAVRIAHRIAAALAAAHARGVVHRDLKPDNVMLVADSEVAGGERVKVLDFGIAKLLGPSGQTPTGSLTRTGLILGTPQYMAPEQCRGSRDVDGKVDVYALGLLLYEVLTGAAPFTASNEWELFAMHLQQQPPPLPPSIPPRLAALVMAMLDKEPERRLAMSEVATRLGELRTPSHQEIPVSERRTLAAATLRLEPAQAAGGSGRPPRTTLSGAAVAVGSGGRLRAGAARLAFASCVVAVALIGVVTWLELAPSRATPAAAAPTAPSATATATPSPAPASPPAASPPAASPPAPTPMASWTLTSLPSGASIDRTDTGEHLGETPWHREQPAAAGRIPVAIRLAGYRTRELTLDLGHDEHRQVALRRRSSPNLTIPGEEDDVQTVH